MNPLPTSAWLLGIDIGGTKCAVVLGHASDAQIAIIAQQRLPTPPTPLATLSQMVHLATTLWEAAGQPPIAAVGISCGGPLDSRRGVVLGPPNLPGWYEVDVVTPFAAAFHAPTALVNDANAGALAEWYWGAGLGAHHLVFLTCGTGMGAGLVLNGALYAGPHDLAGEVGHMRLTSTGPLGYGKAGSFEGWCSGGGIARQAQTIAQERFAQGQPVTFCPHPDAVEQITAEAVAQAAQGGDMIAQGLFDQVAQQLGVGLALLVDMLDPEVIILGGIYMRQRALLEARTLAALETEALPHALSRCRVVPAALGERIGDYAALAIAWQHLR